jgi:hypothetical protein
MRPPPIDTIVLPDLPMSAYSFASVSLSAAARPTGVTRATTITFVSALEP